MLATSGWKARECWLKAQDEARLSSAHLQEEDPPKRQPAAAANGLVPNSTCSPAHLQSDADHPHHLQPKAAACYQCQRLPIPLPFHAPPVLPCATCPLRSVSTYSSSLISIPMLSLSPAHLQSEADHTNHLQHSSSLIPIPMLSHSPAHLQSEADHANHLHRLIHVGARVCGDDAGQRCRGDAPPVAAQHGHGLDPDHFLYVMGRQSEVMVVALGEGVSQPASMVMVLTPITSCFQGGGHGSRQWWVRVQGW